jgi:pimeloyl-ACP methyl ester carboxylesterase
MENRDPRVAELPGAQLQTVDTGGATLTCLVAGEGPVAILAHGFPDCARTFRRQFPALVAAGHRVVAPWLRGYFPSTLARDGRYDMAALGDDLIALARHFSPRDPVRLVGHDWGALAAYAACALAPSTFAHLTTVALPPPRGLSARRFVRPAQLRKSWYIALFQIPGSAEWVLRRDDFALIDRLWRDWSPHFSVEPGELAEIKAALARLPNTRAALAYYRTIVRGAFSPAARLIMARPRVPSLYVHGNDDGCLGVELCEGIERAYAAPVTVARLDGGHFVHLENAERFNALLLGEWRSLRP